MKFDAVIVGGGVIGLSVARRLALRGLSVAVCDRQQMGHEASWAGAGILPPAVPGNPDSIANRLTIATHALWPTLSRELAEATGIDNGFRHCGSVLLDESTAPDRPITFREHTPRTIADETREWRSAGARVEPLDHDRLRALEPDLNTHGEALLLPEACQVRNPRHLKALIADCRRLGVSLQEHTTAHRLLGNASNVHTLETSAGTLHSQYVIVAAGSWSGELLKTAGIELELVPVRGQMLLFKTEKPLLRHVIECGPRYFVPRLDGYLLVGATEELAGFTKENTPQAIENLLEFARRLVPSLAQLPLQKTWAGFRPMVHPGNPVIAESPQLPGLFIATGHFRAGLHLSPITARIVEALVLSEPLPAGLQPDMLRTGVAN